MTRKIGLAVAVVSTMMMASPFPTAEAQTRDDCVIVIQIIDDSSKIDGVCQGTGWFCADFYRWCDGQPYPLDFRPETGHLTIPRTRIALLDEAGAPRGSAGILAGASASRASSCEGGSLFERLDRRPSSRRHEGGSEETAAMPAVTAAAAP